MTGRRLLLASAALCILAVAAASVAAARRLPAAPPAGPTAGWVIGWNAAVAESTRSSRAILADFTGSDWCPACIRLHEEVFASAEFAAWAARRVVPLTVDFPRNHPLPAAQAADNERLGQRYAIEFFPTVILLDAAGKELGRLAYEPGGPQPWIAKAEALLAAAGR